MRLENILYTTVETVREEGTAWKVTVEINPDCEIFLGHFPGQPVVPGVCTLTIIRETLARLLGHDVRFPAIKECKYTGAIIPSRGLRIRFDMQMEGSDTLRCLAWNGEDNVLKLTATVTEN